MRPPSSSSFDADRRYELHGELASGGMATVYLGRQYGPLGFARTVAIKRLHPHFAKESEFVAMFVDEARLAARVSHPNVVSTIDVISREGELLIVMECVRGEALAKLFKTARACGIAIPANIAASIVVGLLHGLHAAHEATDSSGAPLEIVHRDISPQNVLVGLDGIPRIIDFGIAKAARQLHHTREGQVKGKLPYMAPEQLRGAALTRHTDIYAAAVVLWECLTGQWLFDGPSEAAIAARVLEGVVQAPSRSVKVGSGIPQALDEIVLRALSGDPAKRFATARDMAVAIEKCMPLASSSEVGEWVNDLAGPDLGARLSHIAAVEAGVAPVEWHADTVADGRMALALRAATDEYAVATPVPAVPPRPRRSPLVVAAAVFCAIAASVLLLVSLRDGRASAPQSESRRSTNVIAAPVALTNGTIPARDVPTVPPEPPVALAADIELVSEPAVVQAPAATPSTRLRTGKPSSSSTGPHGAKKSGRDCRVPYVTDANGIRRYIPECAFTDVPARAQSR